MVHALAWLAEACVQAGLGGAGLPSEADVTWLESEDAGRLQPLSRYLRRLATGPASDTVAALATPPAGLPDRLPQPFATLRDAVTCYFPITCGHCNRRYCQDGSQDSCYLSTVHGVRIFECKEVLG